MDLFKLIGIVFGATGFWKLIEILFQYRVQQQFKKAEIRNLDIQANNTVVENWVQWSEKMEKRILQLENQNKAQRERINELQRYVDHLEEEVKKYKNSKNEH